MSVADLPRGVRLGLDWGGARIGVAACDAAGMLAYPVETIPAAPDPLPRIARPVDDYGAAAVLLGLPVTLAGDEGLAAGSIRGHARRLARRLAPVGVFLVDERLTTAQATKRLRAAGRSSRRQRAVVDQAAAVAIVEQVLDAERSGHRIAAQRVEPEEEA